MGESVTDHQTHALTIGELAKSVGVNVETVRFYERRGLIPEPPRTGSGYRMYSEADAARLAFIRRAQQLGFTLNETSELLALRMEKGTTVPEIKGRVEAKIADVEAKIRDLEQIRGALASMANSCDRHGPVGDCPFVEALEAQLEPRLATQLQFHPEEKS